MPTRPITFRFYPPLTDAQIAQRITEHDTNLYHDVQWREEERALLSLAILRAQAAYRGNYAQRTAGTASRGEVEVATIAQEAVLLNN